MRLFLTSMITILFSFQVHAVTVGVIDMQKVITSIAQGKSVMKTLEKSFNQKKSKLKKEEQKIMKAKEKLQKESLVLSEKAKAKKQQELQAMVVELQKKTVAYQKQMSEQEQSLKRPILEKLGPVIESVSKKSNVDLTFETSSRPILFAKEKKDLTSAIIKAYDKKYKK